MSRVRSSVTHHKRVKKVLKANKGYRGKRSKLYRVAKDIQMWSMKNAYIGRKLKKRNFRRIWITRIGIFLKSHGLKYSKFIHALNSKNILINRKVLSNMAIEDQKSFLVLLKQLDLLT